MDNVTIVQNVEMQWQTVLHINIGNEAAIANRFVYIGKSESIEWPSERSGRFQSI